MPDGRSPADAGRLALLAAAMPVAHWAVDHATSLELSFDEAQYWHWAQRLDWGYYSKGPLIAWLIAASTAAFGHGEWQVRLPAWLVFDAFLILLFLFARDVGGDRRAGWWAVALGGTCPLFLGIGHLMTTDILQLVCWTWGLWAAYRAVDRGQRSAWYECAIAVGIGTLTKLSILLLPAGIAIALLIGRASGARPAARLPWGAPALTLAIMSPVLLWNAQHGWVMLRHNRGHLGSIDVHQGNPLTFLGSQWIMLGVVVAAVAAPVLFRAPKEAGRRLLWWSSALVLAGFVVRSITDKAQVHWAAPVYVGFLVLLACAVDGLSRRWRQVLVAGMALSVAVALTPITVLRGPMEPLLTPVMGWRQAVRQLAEAAPQAEFILTTSYHPAGELAFYWPRHLPVYVVGAARRHSQHDVWPPPDGEAGRTGLFVSVGPVAQDLLAPAFADCAPLPPVAGTAPSGRTVRVFFGSLCRGYRAIRWPDPRGY